MKFFHISDLHIGKQLYHYSLVEEQKDILQQIVQHAKEQCPDAILIAGDIYDSPVPSAEAVSIFDTFLTELNALEQEPEVCLIAGNHDSAKRIDFASSILAKHRVHIAGMPPVEPQQYLKQVTFEDAYGKVHVYLLPFLKPAYVKPLFPEEVNSYEDAVRKVIEREEIIQEDRNVLVSHQFYTASGASPRTCDSEVHIVGGLENVDVGVLTAFDFVALGHIHGKQSIGDERKRYCGTPLQYSVSEAEDEKTVTMVDLNEKGSAPLITELPLAPMRKVRKMTGKLEDILAAADETNCHDFVSITLTDEVEDYQPKVRLEQKYDHILEIRIDNARTRKLLEFSEEEMESIEPYDAFTAFFKEMNGREMTEEESSYMQIIVNQVQEVTE